MGLRLERLKEVIREEAADVILHQLNDPRIGFCTVTRVDLTRDLSYATLHISVLGNESEKRTTMRGLQNARGLIQSRIAGKLHTRTTPKVEIELDDSIEKTFKILEKIREARASDPDGGRGEPDESEHSPESGEEEAS